MIQIGQNLMVNLMVKIIPLIILQINLKREKKFFPLM